MEQRFRALRTVAFLYRILSWIVLAIGGVLCLLVVIVGAIQGRVGTPSPLVANLPGMNQLTGLLAGLVGGGILLVLALLQFLLLQAASDAIQVGLSIERNTRDMAYYLRGESAMPPPPAAVSWATPQEEAAH